MSNLSPEDRAYLNQLHQPTPASIEELVECGLAGASTDYRGFAWLEPL